MDPQLVQNLRYKLQKRVRRLNSVDHSMFVPSLRQFWAFFDSNQILSGTADSLLLRFPDSSKAVDQIIGETPLVGTTEDEAAAIGMQMLRRIAALDSFDFYRISRLYGSGSKLDEAVETLRDVFLEPFYEFIDEQLDDQSAMLSLLLRYKQRCEWFHRDALAGAVKDNTRRSEALLAMDLYAYLHDQGINFTIEPSSITGEADLVAAQGTTDPIIADTKIFDGEGRGKNYIKKAFGQIYTYTQQFNEPFGYLIIFRTTERDLQLILATESRNIPVVVHNHKTIFILVIDVYPNPRPVSQRDPLKVIQLTESELLSPVQEEGTTS